jgi:hypothetical protein
MKKYNAFLAPSIFAAALCCWLTGCSNTNPGAQQQSLAQDPSEGNLAPVDPPTAAPVVPASSSVPQSSYPPHSSNATSPSYQAESHSLPAYQGGNEANYGGADYYPDDGGNGEPAIEADQPPPPLPEYSQPACPGDNYLWTPGSWSYASAGYYWVPGTWVIAPFVGALYTPPYWGHFGHGYRWYRGYWGPHVGFYGGVNYGYG